jgi:hypothetical protein
LLFLSDLPRIEREIKGMLAQCVRKTNTLIIECSHFRSYVEIVMQDHITTQNSARKWGKRAGIAAFLFFFLKGLVWLGVAVAGAYYALS